MWKEYRSLILAGLIFSFVSLVGYGLYRAPAVMAGALTLDIDSAPALAESASPTGLGTASFLQESAMTASSVYFYVRDSARSPEPLFVGEDSLGYASDGDVDIQQAIWSKDGSVVAVRAKVIASSGQQSSKLYGTFFVDAYDFRSHRSVGKGLPTRQKSWAIKQLIHNRGGEGKVALSQPYADGKVISQKQAEEFKR